MSPPSTSTVAATVRARVRIAEISQEELGRRVGLSQPAISRRMKGAHPWRVDELERLAVILGCSLTDLLTPLGVPIEPAEAAS